MNKLYVGNLSPSVTVEDLKQLFDERKLPVTDQVLLKSGYAFVDFPDQNWAIKAIETLSGKCVFPHDGRSGFCTYIFTVLPPPDSPHAFSLAWTLCRERKSSDLASVARLFHHQCPSCSRRRTDGRINARDLDHYRARFLRAIQVEFTIDFFKCALVSPSRSAKRGRFRSRQPVGMYRMGRMFGR